MLVALLLLLSTGEAADPRVPLVELQIEQEHEAALEVAEKTLEEEPQQAREMGFDHLRGHLLEALNRPDAAAGAYASALSNTPRLSAYSRLRLAQVNEKLRHPEVAAGLVASLLGAAPPRELIRDATRLLERTLRSGGDCRLLWRLDSWQLPIFESRRLELVRSDCALQSGRAGEAAESLVALLRADTTDPVARAAAERITGLPPALFEAPDLSLLLGMAFHHHREFLRSTLHLERTLSSPKFPDLGLSHEEEYQARYASARGYFWRGHYNTAVSTFAELARWTEHPAEKADALYQQARSYELMGRWVPACNTFRDAYEADPKGDKADAALMSALRLKWRLGKEEEAIELLEILASRPQWRGMLERAALFLASSDLVRGRVDQAARWLAYGARPQRENRLEFAYWNGMLAELREDPSAAVKHYLAAVQQDSYHPLARSAAARLSQPPLAERARPEATRLAGSHRPIDLLGAWLILGDEDPEGAAARTRLEERFAADQRTRPFLRLERVPARSWPLWSSNLEEPSERLLALGIVGGSDQQVVLKHFPSSRPSLAYTGGELLASAGRTRQAVYIAESMAKRMPSTLHPRLLRSDYRRLAYPLPYRDLIVRHGQHRGVDPFLLASVIREESRFDAAAFSPASARGLAQFVFSTASRVAADIGIGRISPADLDRPQVSIALGAAYLAELGAQFERRPEVVLAAYNAGEDQARLWKSYCFSPRPEEFFTKVGFGQTRAYLRKVLTSRAHYGELYG